MEDEIQWIDPTFIKEGHFRVRQHLYEESLSRLINSVRTVGIIRPVIIRQVGAEPEYEILAGELRWRAGLQLALPDIPAWVKQPETKRAAIIASLVDNILGDTFDVFEEGDSYKLLIDTGLDHKAISRAIGILENRVALALTLQRLDPESRAVLRGRCTRS